MKKKYLGKGFGAKTLYELTQFLQKKDSLADTLFINPNISNLRAEHVYEIAGFKYIGDFIMGSQGVFRGHNIHCLVKRLS